MYLSVFHRDKATGTQIAESCELEEEDSGGVEAEEDGEEDGDGCGDGDNAVEVERPAAKKRLTEAQRHRQATDPDNPLRTGTWFGLSMAMKKSYILHVLITIALGRSPCGSPPLQSPVTAYTIYVCFLRLYSTGLILKTFQTLLTTLITYSTVTRIQAWRGHDTITGIKPRVANIKPAFWDSE
ncbi:hypothetical protein B0H67DRAFT_555676 [Lasiosphaeris hirsuta]|uniref:Uncharacterized protein n=1 Tax=Lasiosphaeris hirsuta TaxID=260670 RepID=A0AA40A9H3_9PEZI|nr:hypothetical protein B0H67DRAFT_555676 [Lasiosphaeris hirsuta]